MPDTDHTETIVNEMFSELPLREKHIIAHMDEMDVGILEAILERYVEGKGSRIYDGKDVVKRIWAKLHESHRLKVIK
jgi:hypothetical protein